jgi:AraC-like DNA-binding protein/mannose-6-phosphate isomerase-like protein (cupin superfamily)
MSRIGEPENMAKKGTPLDSSYCYTSPKQDIIDRNKMPFGDRLLSVHKHPRFVEIPAHRHNFVEVMYVCQGRYIHTIGGEKIVTEAGDLFFMNEYTQHSVSLGGEDDLAVNFTICKEFFDFAFELVDKQNILSDYLVSLLCTDANWNQYLHIKTKDHYSISQIVELLLWQFFVEQSERSPCNDDQIPQLTMALLLAYITKDLQNLKVDTSSKLEDVTMRSVYAYIKQFYKNGSLSELAKNLHTSDSALSRQIKNASGKTFVELLQDKRFEHATILLKKTDLSISDISNAVGYENSSYFYRQFRDRYGISPKNYRKIK